MWLELDSHNKPWTRVRCCPNNFTGTIYAFTTLELEQSHACITDVVKLTTLLMIKQITCGKPLSWLVTDPGLDATQ
jgi:hypothetical protein